MKVDQFFLKDDNQRRNFSSGYCMFHLSETFAVENIRCKHRRIMQYLILSFFRELPLFKVQVGPRRFLHI